MKNLNAAKVISCLWFLAVMLVLSGCVAHYVPHVDTPEAKLIPDGPEGKTITLINAQPSTEDILIGDAGAGRSVRGNLHAWTDQVISAIKESLEKKHFKVAEGAAKSLKIAITKAALEEAGGGWAYKCSAEFTVELSDGRVITLTAEDHSWKFLNACDGALSEVAATALSDERIVTFLAGQ